jgi:hypothetical protein
MATPPVKVTRSTARVGQHLVGDLLRVAGDHAQHLGRQAGFVQHVGQRQRRQRHLLGRLEHHAVVGGHRRRHLVRHLVERVVERRDGGDDAQHRLAHGVHAAALAVVRQVAREALAVVHQRLLRGEQQHVGGTAHLVQRVPDAQARFQRDQARHLLLARRDDVAGLHQDAVTLVAGQLRLVLVRDAQRTPHVVHAGPGHGGDDFAGVGVADLDHAVAVDLLAGDAHAFALGGIDDGDSGVHGRGSWGGESAC